MDLAGFSHGIALDMQLEWWFQICYTCCLSRPRYKTSIQHSFRLQPFKTSTLFTHLLQSFNLLYTLILAKKRSFTYPQESSQVSTPQSLLHSTNRKILDGFNRIVYKVHFLSEQESLPRRLHSQSHTSPRLSSTHLREHILQPSCALSSIIPPARYFVVIWPSCMSPPGLLYVRFCTLAESPHAIAIHICTCCLVQTLFWSFSELCACA